MSMPRIGFLLHITRTHGIVRRYFVVNGFDGALTMLGLVTGFLAGEAVAPDIVLGACLGAVVALTASGVSSAYISERAERRKAFAELEAAMVADLHASAHGAALRWVPWLIALVNGLAPLSLSLVILTPLMLASCGVALPWPPLKLSLALALAVVFLLGVFLGQVGGTFWLTSGLQALAIAVATMAVILLVG